ncbi:MAG TPA: hypothetical protein VH540_28830 [Ktedonobacterales bacterium]|jgi:hypothetical protein
MLVNEPREKTREILGVWEELWRERAALAWSVERYHRWLRGQGFSRDEAAERAVRILAATPVTFLQKTPSGNQIIH